MTTPSSRPDLDELAAGEIDATDLENLARVATLYDTLDPVPPGLVDRIQFGITLDALHAEIAELTRSGDLVGVRGEATSEAQNVTFTSASLSTMVTITPTADGQRWRLYAEIADAGFDITVRRPADHDCLAVVVPWSRRRFQYTVKDVALPASGTITTAGIAHEVPAGSWAVLDHGRGRWPYNVRWNWGAGAGQTVDGRIIDYQDIYGRDAKAVAALTDASKGASSSKASDPLAPKPDKVANR